VNITFVLYCASGKEQEMNNLLKKLKWAHIIVFTLSLFIYGSPAYPLDRFEIIEQGKAKEYLQKYEEDATKLESEGSLKKAAIMYMEASRLARNSGNYHKGILLGTKAIELSEKTKAPAMEARALFHTAMSYAKIGDYAKSLNLLEKAEALSSKQGTRGLSAKLNEKMGIIYRKTANLKKALEYQKRAYDFYERVLSIQQAPEAAVTPREKKIKRRFSAPGRMRNLIDILVAIGDTYNAMDDYAYAMEFYNKALFYSSDIKEKRLKVYLGIGDLYFNKGDYEKALEYHKKACELSDGLSIPSHTVSSYFKAGRDYQNMENFGEAVAHYRKAIESVEDTRSMLQAAEMRSSYFEQMTRVYNGMISSLMSLGRAEEAFNFSERARARTFLDILGSKVDLSRGMASVLMAEEQEFKRKIAALQLKLEEDASDNPEEPAADGSDIKSELDDLKKQYTIFFEKLQKDDPEHASLVSVEPLALKDVQALLGPESTLLEFHVLGDKTILWVVRKNDMRSVTIKLGRNGIRNLIKNLRESVNDLSSEEGARKILIKLYALLLKDAGLEKGEELVIVPHAALHYLPFHALITPEGRYLIEDHVISYLSSASLVRFTLEKRRKIQGDALAFGNPDLDNPVYNLRYAEREAREMGRLFPKADVFIRKEATKSRAKGISGKYNILHFATHAEFNELNPGETSLRLAMDEKEDGKLSVEEIFTLNLNSSLVVLSACKTDMGTISSGDEIIGLTRAFIYAGTPSVITTLWEVNDKTSYLLMKDFYRNLKTMRKAEALRTAQLHLMKEYHHPFFWAAFVLNGDAE
jgi:CHAT domain-containing protein